jgi:hypothetical protein
MKRPEVEVIRLNGHDIMTGTSCTEDCGANCWKDGYCAPNCNPVQGYCTECMDDCISLD